MRDVGNSQVSNLGMWELLVIILENKRAGVLLQSQRWFFFSPYWGREWGLGDVRQGMKQMNWPTPVNYQTQFSFCGLFSLKLTQNGKCMHIRVKVQSYYLVCVSLGRKRKRIIMCHIGEGIEKSVFSYSQRVNHRKLCTVWQ